MKSTLWSNIVNGGIEESHTLYEQKQRRFFNVMNVFGGLTGFIQGFMAFPIDVWAGVFHLSWGIICYLALFVNRSGNYKQARFITCFTVMVVGSMAAARMGHEFYPHLASYGIVIATIILHDPRTEWGWLVFYCVIEAIMVVIVETNAFKAVDMDVASPVAYRSSILIGTILFVLFEFYYYVNLSLSDEKKISEDLRNANRDMEISNREKSLLLREVHHRVKNNLQVITSLLRLQSYEIEDEKSKNSFLDAMNRVKSIAALHEVMYGKEELMDIRLEDYVKRVAENLIETFYPLNSVDLTVQSDLKQVDHDAIVPLSLILNELISNTLKHGMNGSSEGSIRVNFRKINDQIMLDYADSGTWKPGTEVKSFGKELINTLTEQLDGKVLKHADPDSTSVLIQIPAISIQSVKNNN